MSRDVALRYSAAIRHRHDEEVSRARSLLFFTKRVLCSQRVMLPSVIDLDGCVMKLHWQKSSEWGGASVCRISILFACLSVIQSPCHECEL